MSVVSSVILTEWLSTPGSSFGNCFYCNCALIFQSVTSDLVHCEYKGLDNRKMCTILYVRRRVLVSKHDCHRRMKEIL
jgi:hypothetical protein